MFWIRQWSLLGQLISGLATRQFITKNKLILIARKSINRRHEKASEWNEAQLKTKLTKPNPTTWRRKMAVGALFAGNQQLNEVKAEMNQATERWLKLIDEMNLMRFEWWLLNEANFGWSLTEWYLMKQERKNCEIKLKVWLNWMRTHS